MKIRKKADIIYREYSDSCYLKNEKNNAEIVVNKTAGCFFCFLTEDWQEYDNIIEKVYKLFCIAPENKDSVYKDFLDIVDYFNKLNFIDVVDKKLGTNDFVFQNYIKNVNDLVAHLYTGTFIITEDCNNRCVHCYNSYITRKTSYMTKEIFDKGLKNFLDMGVVTICMSGGEALIHPDIFYFLDEISKTSCRFRLYTNGQNINESLCKKLSNMRLSPASVTLYSIHPEIHDAITQHNGAWNETVNGLRMFKKYSIPFTVSVPLTNLNMDDFEDLFDFCENDLGAISVGPNPFISYTVNHKKTNKGLVMSIEEMKQFAIRYYKYSIERGYDILPQKSNKNEDTKIFHNEFYADLDILQDGSVVSGTLLADIPLGNINNISLRDIWEKSEILEEWRGITLKKLNDCISCPIRDYCSPNIGDNWVANSNVYKVDKHLCELYKIYYKTILKLYEKGKNYDN